MKFGRLAIGELFFEGETGEYYIKESDTTALVYAMNTKSVFKGSVGGVIRCEFPADQQIEDI